MARLTAAEFQELIEALVASEGLGKLQEKLIRSHAVTSRRRVGSAEALSRTLQQLTLGLDRECLPTQVIVAIWEESLRGKLSDEAGAELEKLAERINACLTDGGEILADRRAELESSLGEYRQKLAASVGTDAARLTMLTRAVPAVAALLRANV